MSSDPDSSDSQPSSSNTDSYCPFTAPGCNMCSRKDPSIAYCSNCKHYLCNPCNIAHKIMVCFDSHHVSYFDNVENIEDLKKIVLNTDSQQSPSNIKQDLDLEVSEAIRLVDSMLKMSCDFRTSLEVLGKHRLETLGYVNEVYQHCQQLLKEQKDQIVRVLDAEYNNIRDINLRHQEHFNSVTNKLLFKLSNMKKLIKDKEDTTGRSSCDDSVANTFCPSNVSLPTSWNFDFLDDRCFPSREWSDEGAKGEGCAKDEFELKKLNLDVYPCNSLLPLVASIPSNMTNPHLFFTNDPPPPNNINTMQIYKTFGQKGSSPGQFNSPHGFCLGSDEDIVVADSSNHRVQIFDKTGIFKSQFGIAGRHDGYLWHPRKVALLPRQRRYVVCDRGYERSRMQIFSENGKFVKKIYIQYIDIVAGIAVTNKEDIVVVNSVTPTVFIIGQNDFLRSIDCTGFMEEPSDVTVIGKEFYICDFKAHTVVVVDEDGNFLRKFGTKPTIMYPNGIDVSPAGYILIGDSHGNFFHVVLYLQDGTFVSEFRCPYVKVSRCCGLKVTTEGRLITVDKNYHHVIMLETLFAISQ